MILEDGRIVELRALLARHRREMLWAIAERKPDKAASHARKTARYSRLLLARQEKFGYAMRAV